MIRFAACDKCVITVDAKHLKLNLSITIMVAAAVFPEKCQVGKNVYSNFQLEDIPNFKLFFFYLRKILRNKKFSIIIIVLQIVMTAFILI